MIPTLTPYGIPPQVIGRLTREQQDFITRSYAAGTSDFFTRWKPDDETHPSLDPFTSMAGKVASSFMAWGAKPTGTQMIGVISSIVEAGSTTIKGDHNLHADAPRAGEKLEMDNRLTIRIVAVSGTPAEWFDFTGEPDMESILSRHRIGDTRVYDPVLLTLAKRVVQPDSGEAVLFDGATPHLPKGVDTSGQRWLVYYQGDYILPDNWREHVSKGDVPKIQLGLG